MLEQYFLPVCLALMMLSLGLRLKISDFALIIRRPGIVLLGLAAQFLLMPVFAVAIAIGCGLTGYAAAGLLLVSLAPGGATSNVISALCRGDVALSVTLTALSSVLVPFTLPLFWAVLAPLFLQQAEAIELPYLAVFMPLVLVTLLPLVLGMWLHYCFPTWVQRRSSVFARLMGGLFVVLVLGMAWQHVAVLTALWPYTGLAVLLLCVAGMFGGGVLGKLGRQNRAGCTSLSVEVGVQNAGTAMMVGGTLLSVPQLVMVALCYGILMNVPVAILYGWRKYGLR